MKKDIDQSMIEKMFTLLQDVHTSVKKLEVDVSELKQGQFQHSVTILELKEDVQKIDTRLIRTEKRVYEMYGMLENVTKKVSDHNDEIKANLGLYDQHEKRLTTVETHLRLA